MCCARPVLALPPGPEHASVGKTAVRLRPAAWRHQCSLGSKLCAGGRAAIVGPGPAQGQGMTPLGAAAILAAAPRAPVGERVSGSWSWPRGRQVSVRPPGPHGGHPHPRGVIGGAADCRPMCRYVQHYGLGEACDDIASVLKRVAVKLRKTQKVKVLTGTGETWWPQAGPGGRGLGRSFWGEGLSVRAQGRVCGAAHPSSRGFWRLQLPECAAQAPT